MVTLVKPASGPVAMLRGNFSTLAMPHFALEGEHVETRDDGGFEFARVIEGEWRVRVQTAPEYDFERHLDFTRGAASETIPDDQAAILTARCISRTTSSILSTLTPCSDVPNSFMAQVPKGEAL